MSLEERVEQARRLGELVAFKYWAWVAEKPEERMRIFLDDLEEQRKTMEGEG